MSDSIKNPPELTGENEPLPAEGDAMLRLLDRPLTDDILREATERYAQPRSQPTQDMTSVLLFRIGTEQLAVLATDVARVTRVAVVRRIPHRSNRIIRGLCNIDGELVICGCLREMLELPDAAPTGAGAASDRDERRLVVLGPESNRWAVEADCVLGVRYFETAACKAPPVTVRQAMRCFTTGLLPLSDERVATLLDTTQVLYGFKAALT